MIITVTPNASVDKTYLVEGFGVDRINRPSESWTSSGGKGVNVARVLKELGREALATGFVGGQTGEALLRGLDAEGIRHDFVRAEPQRLFQVRDGGEVIARAHRHLGPQAEKANPHRRRSLWRENLAHRCHGLSRLSCLDERVA